MAKNNTTKELLPTDDNSPTKDILRYIGQPTKYTPEACEKIIEVAAKGGHIAAMILAVGAKSKSTFNDWVKKYPEFAEAAELAKIVSQAYWEHPEIMKSMPATQWAMTVNNKFSEDYNRNPGMSGTTNNINFNTLNLSDSQKMDRIKGLLVKLNSAGKEMGEIYDGQSYDESDDD